MENEIKTLKDIEVLYTNNPSKDMLVEFYDKLKTEAIKKIKFIKENHRMPTPIKSILRPSEEYFLIKYIMWDNDLKEEDLE